MVSNEHKTTRRIPRRRLPGKGMRLARQAVPLVTQHPVQALLVDRVGARDRFSQHVAHLNPHHPASTTMLGCPRQSDSRCEHQAWSAHFTQALRVPIHSSYLATVHLPPVTDPWHAALTRCLLARLGHDLGSCFILRSGKGPGHHTARGAIHAYGAPTQAHPGRRVRWVSSRNRRITTSSVRATSVGCCAGGTSACPGWGQTSDGSCGTPNAVARSCCRSSPHGWPHSEDRGMIWTDFSRHLPHLLSICSQRGANSRKGFETQLNPPKVRPLCESE
ncbi:MAG: hypothetical protein KatS3mg053_1362 [Candidatus Roseilinea sp.]|nr:MAG: hypothetical protein KatS3mg053_1362 [Candidatus Roseilinea sp.]